MLNNNDNQSNQAYLFIFFILKSGTHTVCLENSGPLLKSMQILLYHVLQTGPAWR